MSLEYAPRGLVGMLTPQANTTVEPEFNILWPRGVAMINARLMSGKASMTARLVDYFDNYAASLAQFANAPVGVVAAACTGASYLAGREREAAVARDIAERHKHPFITAAVAVVDALTVLKAKRIGLVSPYPDDSTRRVWPIGRATASRLRMWRRCSMRAAHFIRSIASADRAPQRRCSRSRTSRSMPS